MELRSLPIIRTLFLTFFSFAVLADSHTNLLPYVQEAPDQGKTGACLFMASTGAMELLLNRLNGVENPQIGGEYDLSENYLINAPRTVPSSKSFFERPIYRFKGEAVHNSEWPFEAWNGEEPNRDVWVSRDTTEMKKIEVPDLETRRLFNMGDRYATDVLKAEHIERVKEALKKWNSPILINYKDNKYWHVILIVGFDDEAEGECYQISEEDCQISQGSFYVRDSFGKRYELRDYDWFLKKANAAFVVYNPKEISL